MNKFFKALLFLVFISSLLIGGPSSAQVRKTPFELLKEYEIMHRDSLGAVYIGQVMTVNYRPGAIDVDTRYHPLLLELTDVLKTPSRMNYSIILKGYTDSSGSSEGNIRLARQRAQVLKNLMTTAYYMKPERIEAQGFGSADPLASNQTPQGKYQNRRTEIHLYGNVSEAVKFSNKLEALP